MMWFFISSVLLLKCLKIMENAAFLSKDNQNHLLGMNGNLDGEGSNLPFRRLILSAIKHLQVLMNLTNDNPVGCQQIAAYGGLETISSLIVDHFPSFIKCLHTCANKRI